MLKKIARKIAAGFAAIPNVFNRKPVKQQITNTELSITEKRPQELFISMEIPSIIQRKPNKRNLKQQIVQKQTSQRKNWSKWKKRL